MAAMKNSRTRMAAADLPDDIILHIIARLPLKYAARCRVLNKYFCYTISTPKFVLDHHELLSSSSSNNSIIFHQAGPKFTRINSRVPKSITVPTEPAKEVMILDSCNGLLLLFCPWSGYYVFNPFTGGVMFLKYWTNWLRCGSLVVDINPSLSTSFDFKLVELKQEELGGARGPTRLLFRVYVPLRKNKLVRSKLVQSKLTLMKYFDLHYQGSFDPFTSREREQRPVYTHGCVHWLGVGATAIAAFDVQSGRARIMDGPVTHAVDCQIWFGSAQGSLQFIRTDNSNNFIVHTHNYVTQEWRVAHKIQMPELGIPVFFDGKNVFFHMSKSGNIDTLEIFVHDLSMGESRKSGEVDAIEIGSSLMLNKCHRYLEYVPTRASGVYLWKMPAKQRSTLLGICLLGLQDLLLD